MHRRCCFIPCALFACYLLSSAAPVRAASALSGKAAPILTQDIPYPGAAKGDRRRSLDLYLPANAGEKPPLLIFVHGGFWLLSDDEYRIGPAVAEALVRDGVAVALLRYRLGPSIIHPKQAEDVAAGVALLIREAQRYGYDDRRIFLSGHSAGSHLAALVALDPKYLAKHQASPKSLAGLITFSGLYDLAPPWPVSENQKYAIAKTFGNDPAVLKQASPLAHVRAGAPPFLILGAENDLPGFLPDAKKFADALTRTGNPRVQRWIVPERDHFTALRLGDRDNEG